ncbi:MAG: hypothetical protein VKN13_02120 [Cyanobacteriota bacterium]|nr:hypothetical protein [Cyanobacteriota bacterium]
MAPSIRIIQNCYLPEQLQDCTFESHFNPIPSPLDERYLFCESNVIRQLVLEGSHHGYDYFGVLGHAWIAKLRESREWGIPIKNVSQAQLTAAGLIAYVQSCEGVDFVSFGRFISHRVFQIAEQTHPGWRAATSRILGSLGIRYDLDRVITSPIYFNFFVGRSPCLEAYVRELLSPAIEAAVHDPEIRKLCLADAGYFRHWSHDLSHHFRINHYPLHPFIGERLINIYIDLAGSSVSSYDQEWGPLSRWAAKARLGVYQAHWHLREARLRRQAQRR